MKIITSQKRYFDTFSNNFAFTKNFYPNISKDLKKTLLLKKIFFHENNGTQSSIIAN